jgi:predicted transposase/invertase (TIGR01784 family)
MIDHDRLFKELLSTFFVEFIELFFPEVMEYLEPDSITFLDKEIFTDVTAGERHETDLVVRAKFRGRSSFFLIHIENQSESRGIFGKRMFRYFARLDEKHDLPIYPIAVLSYDKPQQAAISNYQIDFPDFQVLQFNYRVVQLNQFNWRDFINQRNPLASALMAKMKIDRKDRPKVKAECLRLLVTLKLDPARMQLISGFVDTYLRLNKSETREFESEVRKFGLNEREEVMQIVTSWMEQGIEQGRKEGVEQGRKEGVEQGLNREIELILRMLAVKFSSLDSEIAAQIRQLELNQLEDLGIALLNFQQVEDLTIWLSNLTGNSAN